MEVLRFELCGAPAAFQTLINDYLREFVGSCTLVYLNDVLMYSNSVAEHDSHKDCRQCAQGC